MKMAIYENLWDATKAVFRKKFIAISIHIKKQKDLKCHFTLQGIRKSTN